MIVVICPTTQEKMCTTGSLRMAAMRSRNSLRVVASASDLSAEAQRAKAEAIQTLYGDAVWIASSLALLAMTALERPRQSPHTPSFRDGPKDQTADAQLRT